MIKLGSTTIKPQGYKKVMKGDYLIWENSIIEWITDSKISPNARIILLPDTVQKKLGNKQIVSIKFGSYGEITEGIKVDLPFVNFDYSLSHYLNTGGYIEAGTKLTIKYKA
ncbi:hypothetical protein [Finegoldia magna]|uniref:Uncharacterized protein n=1 Tax=Finegoldia magna BVS033A4 TaxID=866773 RepID=E1KWH3_FINMA|nr:hypothetical protein [Finegoldia magna]EFL54638.1 hypothetical protein HMPREF9289_0712 [Finegoldia magna BVS033A4]